MADFSGEKLPTAPFNSIALCCSGGGYRAAAFHLGGLSYLQRLHLNGRPLLEHVKRLSTVSGGTITGVTYALHSQQGKPFVDFYHFLLDRLKNVDLVRLSLEKLEADHVWVNPGKRRNVINAFSEIYDTSFTEGKTFDVFDDMRLSHLEEVMFNATDFSTGVVFRFQNEGRLGNYYNPIKRRLAEEIKLSDVIAASSCFTGGFEPIDWPNDFLHAESFELREALPFLKTVGLMDGGIYDNQGIDSVLLSEDRVSAVQSDLILVSDVTSPYMKPFSFFEEKKKEGWRSWTYHDLQIKVISRIKTFRWVAMIVLLSSMIILFWNKFANNIATGVLFSAGLLALVLFMTLNFVCRLVRKKARHAKEYIVQNFGDEFPFESIEGLSFGNIPLGDFEVLVADRIRSLITLVEEVFLKTVRRLVYGRLYDSEKYRFRRASCLIRDLTKEDFELKQGRGRGEVDYFQNLQACPPELVGDYDSVIGARLKMVAEEASSFGTTLWFTPTDEVGNMLNSLLITGQATMCFKILRYMIELKSAPAYHDLDKEVKESLELVWLNCLEDWKRFKADPEFLADIYLARRSS